MKKHEVIVNILLSIFITILVIGKVYGIYEASPDRMAFIAKLLSNVIFYGTGALLCVKAHFWLKDQYIHIEITDKKEQP